MPTSWLGDRRTVATLNSRGLFARTYPPLKRALRGAGRSYGTSRSIPVSVWIELLIPLLLDPRQAVDPARGGELSHNETLLGHGPANISA